MSLINRSIIIDTILDFLIGDDQRPIKQKQALLLVHLVMASSLAMHVTAESIEKDVPVNTSTENHDEQSPCLMPSPSLLSYADERDVRLSFSSFDTAELDHAFSHGALHHRQNSSWGVESSSNSFRSFSVTPNLQSVHHLSITRELDDESMSFYHQRGSHRRELNPSALQKSKVRFVDDEDKSYELSVEQAQPIKSVQVAQTKSIVELDSVGRPIYHSLTRRGQAKKFARNIGRSYHRLVDLVSRSFDCLISPMSQLLAFNKHSVDDDQPAPRKLSDRDPVAEWRVPYDSPIGADYFARCQELYRMAEQRPLFPRAVLRESPAADLYI